MNSITSAMYLKQTFYFFMQKEMEQTLETEHEFVENVPQQEIPSVAIIPTNSEVICRPCQDPLHIPLQIYTYSIV